MKTLRFLASAALLLQVALRAEEDRSSLLDGHLAQAAEIAPTSRAPGTDAALGKLRADIAAKLSAWRQTLETNPDLLQLLAGIPEPIIAQARKAADDSSAATRLLKAEPTLDGVLALAAFRNPEVKSAYQNWRASLNRFEQATYLEDLVSQYRSFVRELDTKVGPQSHKEMPAKTFPFPSALALKGRAVDLETEIARISYQQTLRKTLNDIARACFDAEFARNALIIVKENRTLIQQMENVTRELIKAGNANQADNLKAQTMLAMLENKILTYERQRTNSVAQISALLGLSVEAQWEPAPAVELRDESISLDAAIRAARSGNQEVLRASKEAELMPVMVRMAETMLYSRAATMASQLAPSLGAEAGPTRAEAAAFPNMVEVSPENAAFGSNAAYINELRVRVKQSESMLADATARAEFMAKDAHFRLDVARRDQKTISETVVPKAKQAFDATKQRYANGLTTFIEFLDAGRTQVDSTLMLEEARRDLKKGLADLQDAMGGAVARLIVRKQ